MELLTIVIPTRDRADFLEDCLRSVFESQKTISNVIVSDNSTSNHASINGLRSRYDFTYIRQSGDIGMTEHFNICLGLASTPWVMLLHDDDELYPGSLHSIDTALEKYADAGILIGGIQSIDRRGRVRNEWISQSSGLFKGEEGLLRLGLDWKARPPGTIYNAGAVRQIGGMVDVDGKAADYVIAMHLTYAYGVFFSPQLLGRYRYGDQQTAQFGTPEQAEAWLRFAIKQGELTRALGCSVETGERIVDYLAWYTFLVVAPKFLRSHGSFVFKLAQKCLGVSKKRGEWQMRVRTQYPLLFRKPQWLSLLLLSLLNKIRYFLKRLAFR